ncbi:hypothetical protein TrCOL_g10863 [Triparma columacea]|uniref:Uncharacterized protein n=1 Tax=Triparma columacea TaxID=722753 RepID=A0A9W7FWX4_9STRA|nr:hypothetical protein TrCOL_g10863 [Triparma columacea]
MFKKKKKSSTARAYRATPSSTAIEGSSISTNETSNDTNEAAIHSTDQTIPKDVETNEEEDNTVVINPNKQTNSRKRLREDANDSQTNNNQNNNQTNDKDSVLYSYAASSSASKLERQKGDAFRTLTSESASSRDARSMHEEKVRLMDAGLTNDETGEYRGMNAYSGIIKKSVDSIRANKHTGKHGALRANTFVRTTSRFDYQPDVCKDYKETGFCGFGDTCIFMHDRTDMKKGWELEEEWERKVKERREKEEKALKGLLGEEEGGDEEEEGGVNNGLPFACGICRNHFEDPVVTTCGHYFCGKCGRGRYKVDKSCHACGKDVGGVFNEARKLVKACKVVAGGDWKEFKRLRGGKKRKEEEE